MDDDNDICEGDGGKDDGQDDDDDDDGDGNNDGVMRYSFALSNLQSIEHGHGI